MLILGIETSCDETAVAVVKDGDLVLSNVVSSQIDLHAPYGGVVPEVAARSHVENILPIIEKSLSQAKIKINQIDAIAVTYGPGLITSLLIGVDTAKTISYSLNKKLIGVNHIISHVYASILRKSVAEDKVVFKYPLLYLIVSGGHTELILMKSKNKFESIGATRDDAAGEAFDKVAKLLSLSYPGGPIISKLANLGNSRAYSFPRPMLNDGLDFSFSGLKTDVFRLVQKKKGKFSQQEINDICASFQTAVVEVLVTKTLRAAQEYNVKMITIGGGVSCNIYLGKMMSKEVAREIPSVDLLLPKPEFSTDNAAMIAAAGYYLAKQKKFTSWNKLTVNPNLSI